MIFASQIEKLHVMIRDAGYAKRRVHENKNKDHCIAKDIFNKMSMKAE